MSAAEGASEASEASEASKQVSGAGDRANGQASGPVLTSLFLFVPDHSATTMPAPTSGWFLKKRSGNGSPDFKTKSAPATIAGRMVSGRVKSYNE